MFCAPSISQAQVNSWLNNAAGFWDVPGNWSLGLPQAAHDLQILFGGITTTHQVGNTTAKTLTSSAAFTLSGGSLTLDSTTVTSTISNAFNLTGGSLTGANNQTVSGLMTFSSGSLTGTGTTTASGGIAFNLSGDKFIGRSLIAASNTVWTDTGAVKAFGGTFTNQATRTFNVQNSQTWNDGIFNNQGSLLKTANAGISTFGVALSGGTRQFNNTGAVDAQIGTIAIAADGTHTGSFAGTGSGNVTFQSGTHTFNNGSSIAGTANFTGASASFKSGSNVTGNVQFTAGGINFDTGSGMNGGTLTVAGANLALNTGAVITGGKFAVNSGTMTVNTGLLGSANTLSVSNSGTMTLNGAITFTGAMSWSSGTISGTGSATVAGGSISSTSAKVLSGSISNSGTMSWSGTGQINAFGGTLTNQNGATLNVIDDTTFFDGILNNQGTLNKNTSGGVLSIGAISGGGVRQFNNSGIVNANVGTIQVHSSGTHSGSFATQPAALITFTAGNHAFNMGSSFVGVFSFGSSSISAFNSGVNVAGNLTFSGTSDFNSGSNLVGVGVSNSGTMNFNAGSGMSGGSIQVSGGLANWSNTASVAGGTISILGGTAAFGSTTGSAASISVSNSGTFTGTGAVSTNTLNWSGGSIIGSGSLLTAGGAITGSTPKTLSRSVSNSGTMTITNTANVAASGSTFTNNPGATFNLQSDMLWLDGIFVNQGIFNKTVGAGATSFGQLSTGGIRGFSNSGTMSIQAGTLNIAADGTHVGTFSTGGAARLRFTAGVQDFNNGASLAGTIDIAGATANFNAGSSVTGTLNALSGTVNLNPGSSVPTGHIQVLGATVNFNTGGTYPVGDLTEDGHIGGTDLISVSGTFNWLSGTQSGSGGTSSGGTMSIQGSGSKNIGAGRTITNNGFGSWSGTGSITGATTGMFVNSSTGTFLIDTDADWGSSVSNSGTMDKVGSGTLQAEGETLYSGDFTNNGIVQVSVGTLAFSGNRFGNGDWFGEMGTTLWFQNGNQTLGNGAEISTTGTFRHSGGSTTFGNGSSFSAEDFLFQGGTISFEPGSTFSNSGTMSLIGGTLAGAGNVTFTAPLTWAYGAMSGTGTTTLAQGGSATGVSTMTLTGGRRLVNQGLFTWSGTATFFNSSDAVFTNEPTGTFNALTDTTYSGGTIINLGVLKKGATSGTGTTHFSNVPITNDGQIRAEAGTLRLTGHRTGGGDYIGLPGTTLWFEYGNHNLGAGADISSLGTVRFSNHHGSFGATTTNFNAGSSFQAATALFDGAGTTNFNLGSVFSGITNGLVLQAGVLTLSTGNPISVGTFTQSGGAFGGSDNLTVTGTTNWFGGTHAGSGITTLNGALQILGSDNKSIAENRTVILNANSSWGGTGLFSNSPTGILKVGAGRKLSLMSDAAFFQGTLHVDGTLEKVGSAGTYNDFRTTFINNGLVDVKQGSLFLVGNRSGTGDWTGSAGTSLIFDWGNQNLDAGASISSLGSVTLGNYNGSFGISTTNFNAGSSYSAAATTFDGGSTNFNTGSSIGTLGSTVQFVDAPTVTFNTGSAVTFPNFTISTGAIGGNDTLNLNGGATINGGIFFGSSTLNVNAPSSIIGSFSNAASQVFKNNSTIIWTGGTLSQSATATFNNSVGAVLDLKSDVDVTNGIIVNAGTIRKTGMAADESIFSQGSILNTGLIDIQMGRVRMQNLTGTGDLKGSAGTEIRLVAGGTVVFSAGAELDTLGHVTFDTNTTFEAGSILKASAADIVSGAVTMMPGSTLTSLGGKVNLLGGSLLLDTGTPKAFTNFEMSGAGSLWGQDNVTFSGPNLWQRGFMGGTGTTFITGTTNASPQASMGLTAARKLINSGVFDLYGTLSNSADSTIENAVGGILDFRLDADLVNGALINSGTIRKASQGSEITTINPASFLNTGLVEVLQGQMRITRISGSGDLKGATGTALFLETNTSSFASGAEIDTLGSIEISAPVTMEAGSSFKAGSARFAANVTNFLLGSNFISAGPKLELVGGSVVFDSGTVKNLPALDIRSGSSHLAGSDVVNVAGTTNWAAGYMSGNGITNLNGPVVVGTEGVTGVQGPRQVRNAATMNLFGSMNNVAGASFENLVSGTVNIHNDGSWSSGSLINKGVIRRNTTSALGNFVFTSALDNQNLIEATQGSLRFTSYTGNGGDLKGSAGTVLVIGSSVFNTGSDLDSLGTVKFDSGNASFNSGATYKAAKSYFDGGAVSLNAGSTLVSLGTSPEINGGSLNISTGTTHSIADPILEQGAFGGTDNLSLTGNIRWRSTFLFGASATNFVGTTTVIGSSRSIGDSHAVNNSGLMNVYSDFSSGSFSLQPTGILSNLSSGTMNIASDTSFTGGSFINAGMLQKSETYGGITTISSTFTNTGTLDVMKGVVYLQGAVSNYATPTKTLTGGTYRIGTGAFLRFNNAGIGVNASDFQLYGTGASVIDLNAANAFKDLTANSGNLAVTNGASVSLDQDVANTGTMSAASTGAFNMAKTLTNAGSVSIANAVLNVHDNIVNNGSMAFSGTSLVTVDDNVSNSNALSIASCTANIGGTFTQTAGTTTLAAGTLKPTGGATLNGGLLVGAGTVFSNLVNSAKVAPGPTASIIQVQMSYTQSASGHLDVDIFGRPATQNFDKLIGNGTANLNGTLNVTVAGSTNAVAGDEWEILTFASGRIGTFSTVNFFGIGSQNWTFSYHANAVRVKFNGGSKFSSGGVVTTGGTYGGNTNGNGGNGVVPEPSSVIAIALGVAGFFVSRRTGRA